jgi:hypothetical protein
MAPPHRSTNDSILVMGGSLNTQSIRNKCTAIIDFIIKHELTILAINETWLTGNVTLDNAIMKDSCPPNYQSIHKPRIGKKGGGLAFIFKTSLKTSTLPLTVSVTTFECLPIKVTVASKTFVIINIYRPPSTCLNIFYEELADLFAHFLSIYEEVIFVGDFNVRILTDARIRSDFNNLLACFNLSQHVSSPTHCKGDILDLIITRSSSCFLIDISIKDGVADHMSVLFKLSVSHTDNINGPIIKRSFSHLNMDEFKSDLLTVNDNFLRASNSSYDSIKDCGVDLFHNTVAAVMDHHAPLKIINQTRKQLPWINNTIIVARRYLRKLERQWRLQPTNTTRANYTVARSAYHTLLKKARMKYISNKLNDNHHHPKRLWSLLNSSLQRKSNLALPNCDDHFVLANQFNKFFIEKILTIKAKLPSITLSALSASSMPATQLTSILHKFELITPTEVLEYVKNSPKSSNRNDPLPPFLLWRCIHQLLPSITHIVNWSLLHGMPRVYKHAIITPLLKKSSLDKDILGNYRPVSNLCFVSKVIERVVASQLMEHLTKNNILDPFQSAYRKNYSTETLLTHLQDQIIRHIDDNKVVILVLLDLSSAFDTVHHDLLLQKLESAGITECALEWFREYLSERTHSTSIYNTQSTSLKVPCGVPQGSVLGPILFSLYICGIRQVFINHSIQYHCYADDTQMFEAAKISELPSVVQRIESCLEDVSVWLAQCHLSLNSNKTEILILGSKQMLAKCPSVSIKINGESISAIHQVVRNLGVYFDANLSMCNHISKVSSTAFTNIRLISRIRSSLSVNICKQLVHSLVFSHIDYCGSLLYGINKNLMARLQRIIHAAVRMCEKLKKEDSVTSHLKRYGWLPAEGRILKRALILIYKVVRGATPEYLKILIDVPKPVLHESRILRSQSQGNLPVQRCNKKLGERAFSYFAQRLWNELPSPIRDSPNMKIFTQRLDVYLIQTFYC